MDKCFKCGCTGTGFRPAPGHWREKICDSCFEKHLAADAKNAKQFYGCLFSVIGGPLKLLFRMLRWLCVQAGKLLMNKWVWTVFSCGMTWVAWKVLDKVYSPKD